MGADALDPEPPTRFQLNYHSAQLSPASRPHLVGWVPPSR